MKKVEKFIGFDGISRNWVDLENLYYPEVIRRGAGRYQTPIDRLNTLFDSYNKTKTRLRGKGTLVKYTSSLKHRKKARLLKFIIEKFKEIVLSTPQTQERLINLLGFLGYDNLIYDINTEKQTYFGGELEWAFRYDDFRAEKLVLLAENQNIKTCLYCNSQYTLVVKQDPIKLAKFQFDHFFPKSRFPYLSISLYNLVPSCAACNHTKSNEFYKLNEFTHPFVADFNNMFRFIVPQKIHLELLMGKDVSEKDITTEIEYNNQIEVTNYIEKFHLDGIYQRHSDIVKEVYNKAYAYKNGGKKALLDLEDKKLKISIFKNKEEIERMLLANYTLEKDINKRPLSKFMQDMAENSGLIVI